MSEFTCLLGEPALSAFRRRKLTRRIAAAAGAEPSVEARFVYLIESEADPAPRRDWGHAEDYVARLYHDDR